MEELQTINEIVNTSIRDSSYIAVIISSSVFIIYTLIIRLIDYFKSKAKDKPLLEMSKAMKEALNDMVVDLDDREVGRFVSKTITQEVYGR